MFEVIEYEEQPSVPEVPVYEIAYGLTTGLPQPKGLGHGGQDKAGIGDRSERHEHDAVGGQISGFAGHLQGETGLAHPAWTGERNESRATLFEQGARHEEVPSSSDERGGGYRQVGYGRRDRGSGGTASGC